MCRRHAHDTDRRVARVAATLQPPPVSDADWWCPDCQVSWRAPSDATPRCRLCGAPAEWLYDKELIR